MKKENYPVHKIPHISTEEANKRMPKAKFNSTPRGSIVWYQTTIVNATIYQCPKCFHGDTEMFMICPQCGQKFVIRLDIKE